MKDINKRFKNFSKLLFDINFHQNHHYLRNSRTISKKEIKKYSNQNSLSNLIEPEVEYVSKLNFYSPEAMTDRNASNNNYSTMPNFSPSLKYINKNILDYIEGQKLQSFEENKFANQIKENKLENKRMDLEKKMSKIKSFINSLNEELSQIITETENLKLDFEILQNNKTVSIIEKNFKKTIKANELLHKSKTNKLPFLSNKTIMDKKKERKEKIDTLLSKHKEDMKSKKNHAFLKIKQLNEKKKEILQKIKLCENDMKNFKEERNKIKKELLLHYHNVLLEGKDTRKEGLSWIIKAIWNLKSNVLLSYLPKYLDQQSISFLFSYSMKQVKMNTIYKIIQALSVKLKQKEEIKEKRSVSKDNTVDEESNTIETNIFDYNGYNNTSKESIEQEENNKDIININLRKNKEWLKGIIKTNSIIFKENNQLNLFNRPKEIILDIIHKNNKNKYVNARNDFRTNLYHNMNYTDFQLKREKNKIQENKTRNFLDLFHELDENKTNNCLFNQNLLKRNKTNNKDIRIKLTDFENIYNNSRKELDEELLELYNTRKKVEQKYLKLKDDIEKMIKNELDRINKCFCKEDYEAKYNIDQKSLIYAIIGEENGKNEYIKQIIKNKKYFKTLKELRKGINQD